MRSHALPFPSLGLVLIVAAAAACQADPIHDGAVAAQGKEVSGVPIGQYHRAGQPCLVCHEEKGPSKAIFAVAGTVFAGPNSLVGVDGAEVRLTDSGGSQFIKKTNCVGNFFITPDEWNSSGQGGPRFPLLVRIAKGGASRTMRTAIGREGSCGFCHVNSITDQNQLGSMPHIYLFAGDDPSGPAKDCPVNPDLGTP